MRAPMATALAVTMIAMAQISAAAAYPDDPITIIVPSAPGGGTDATARLLADGLEDQLGVPVNVVNRAGGGSLIGHTEIVQAEPDGYTIGVVIPPIVTHHWVGQSDITYEDLTPLALYNFDPAGIEVSGDSDLETLEDALAWMGDNPGFSVAGAARYGAWHLAFVRLLQAHDLPLDAFTFVPGHGAAPALNELVAGDIAFTPVSLAEAKGLVDAGEVRALAVLDTERSSLLPEVPTVAEVTGKEVVSGAWRGIAGPADMPPDVVKQLTEALRDVHQSEAFRAAMTRAGFGLRWREGEDFREFLAKADREQGDLLKALGAI
jgi:tripartite-type tricarboxylate transporter receptor subunit TctC